MLITTAYRNAGPRKHLELTAKGVRQRLKNVVSKDRRHGCVNKPLTVHNSRICMHQAGLIRLD